MIWIERHLRLFLITAITSAAVAVIIVFYSAVLHAGETSTIERYQLGLLVSPWAVFFGSVTPLVYYSWFRKLPSSPGAAVLQLAMRLFFWLFVVVEAVVFGGIYIGFVFR